MYYVWKYQHREKSCELLSTTCQAVCVCSYGFAGSSCSLTASELEQRQQIRYVLLSALINMTQSSTSAAMITALASSLSAETISQDELTLESSTPILSIANTLLSFAEQFKVDQQIISRQILMAIDAAAGLQNISMYSITRTNTTNYYSFLRSCILPKIALKMCSPTSKPASMAYLDRELPFLYRLWNVLSTQGLVRWMFRSYFS